MGRSGRDQMLRALLVVAIASRPSGHSTDITTSYDEPVLADDSCFLQLQQLTYGHKLGDVETLDAAKLQEAKPRWDHSADIFARARPASSTQGSDSRAWRYPYAQHTAVVKGLHDGDLLESSRSMSRETAFEQLSTQQFFHGPGPPPRRKPTSVLGTAAKQEMKHQLSELMSLNFEMEQKIKEREQNDTQVVSPPRLEESLPFPVPGWVEPAIFFGFIGVAVCCCATCLTYCIVHELDGSKEREQGMQTASTQQNLQAVKADCTGLLNSCSMVVVATLMCFSMLFFLCLAGLWKIQVVQQWSTFLTLFGLIFCFCLCWLFACFYTWTLSRRQTAEGAYNELNEIVSYVEYLTAMQTKKSQLAFAEAQKHHKQQSKKGFCG